MSLHNAFLRPVPDSIHHGFPFLLYLLRESWACQVHQGWTVRRCVGTAGLSEALQELSSRGGCCMPMTAATVKCKSQPARSRLCPVMFSCISLS